MSNLLNYEKDYYSRSGKAHGQGGVTIRRKLPCAKDRLPRGPFLLSTFSVYMTH